MKFEVTETGACSRRIAIEVEPELVEERITDLVREYRRTKVIPGFRPGRASDALIRQRFGKQIRSEVLQDLIPEAWDKALEEHHLEAVAQPEFDEVKAEPGQPVKVSGNVEIKPHVEIKDYKGIKVTREIRTVTDEEVDAQIEMIRQRHADEVPVDRPAEMGDVVVATIQQMDPSGIPLIGRKDADRRWQLGGPGSVSRDMDEQLVGVSKGEARVIAYHYRDDLYDQSRAGREDRAQVTVTGLFERQVPEIDEDFLKDLGDFKTVDDLKKVIREDLERRVRMAARRQVHEQLRDRIIQANLFEVPESLVERYLTNLFKEHEQEGHEHDEKGFREEHRAEAINQVRGMLALERIAKQEGIKVTDEEVDKQVAVMAAGMRTNPDNLRRYMVESGRYESLRAEMREEAVLEFVEEQAKVEEVTIKNK